VSYNAVFIGSLLGFGTKLTVGLELPQKSPPFTPKIDSNSKARPNFQVELTLSSAFSSS